MSSTTVRTANPNSVREVIRLALLASGVGAVSAYAALGFVVCIGAVQELLVGFGHSQVTTALREVPWWRVVLAPAVGGLAVGLLVLFAVRGPLAQGPAAVVESVHAEDGNMPFRRGLVSAIASVISTGAGASVGRYGPAVHLGATLGSWLGRYVSVDRNAGIALLGAGVAAAIAAAFNAPLAGVLFAHEVVISGFAARAVMPTVVASAIGASIARGHGGALALFALPDHGVDFTYEYPLFLVVGLLGGGLAIGFMYALDLATRNIPRIPVPDYIRPMLGGILIGVMALGFPQIFGLGEEAIQTDLKGHYALWLLLALIPIKIIATSCSVGFGFYGGVLGPALFVGAMMGAAFGLSLDSWFPVGVSGAAVYAIAGMGAVISRIVGAPIATVLIVLELTNSYTTTTGAMIAIVVASVVWSSRFPSSFFHFQLAQRGIDPGRGREVVLLEGQRVGSRLSSAQATVLPDATVAEAINALLRHRDQDLFIVNEAGALLATAELRALVEAERRGEGSTAVSAVANASGVVLEADTDLHEAMRIVQGFAGMSIPVVKDRDSMRLIGVIHASDLIEAYGDAVEAVRAEQWRG